MCQSFDHAADASFSPGPRFHRLDAPALPLHSMTRAGSAPATRASGASRATEVAGLAASLSGVAVALWAIPGSVDIVSWRGSVAERVALILPLWTLAALVAGAIAAALIIARRVADPRDTALRLAGLRWLWLLIVPFVPHVAGALPQVLLFDGPLAWVLCGAVFASLVGPSLMPLARRARGLLDHRVALLALVTSIYAGLGWYVTSHTGPGGDEPHYLVIAQSLWADGDLQIANQHEERQYRAFLQRDIRPHFLKRGVNDVIYSIHAPGLPVLALPAYALGGYRGVVLWLALVAAIGAVAMLDVARRVGGDAVAWLTFTAMAATVPFAPHAWLVYPEMPAAAIVALAMGWLWKDETRDAAALSWVARGAALALLPWLHTKFVVLMAGLVAGLAWRLWPRARKMGALAVVPAVSAALWLYSFYVMYGVANPVIPYGSASRAQLAWDNVPRGLLGLVFDQEFGLLLHAPALFAAPLGAWYLLRTREWRVPTVVVLCTAGAFTVTITRVYMWWGGWSVPGRFVVPMIPLVCPLMAGLLRAWSGTWRVRVVAAAVAWGVLAIGWSLVSPQQQILLNQRDGVGKWLSALQGAAPLTSVWPTYFAVDWAGQWPRTLGFVMGLACFAIVMSGLEWRWPAVSPWRTIVRVIGTGLVALAIGSSLSIAPDDRTWIAARGGMDLLAHRVHSSSRQAVDPDTYAPLSRDAVRDLVRLRAVPLEPHPRTGRVAGPFRLEAGLYRLVAWGTGQQEALPPEATLALEYNLGDGVLVLARGPQSSPLALEFELPIPLGDLWVTRGAPHDPGLRLVEIQPLRLDPPASADAGPPHDLRPLAGIAGGYVFGLDGHFYSEGNSGWVRGQREAEFLVAGASATRLRVRVGNGPLAQVVRVSAEGVDRRLELPPNGEAGVELPLPGPGRFLRVRVASTVGFTPRDHNPAANDSRWLGCRLTFDAS